MGIGIVLCITMAIFAHIETQKQAAQQSVINGEFKEKQDILYAAICSDNYPLVVMDQNGKIVQWNDAMVDLTGIAEDVAKMTGMDAIMCDSVKLQKHKQGVVAAFQNPDMFQKLTIVNCEIFNKEGKQIPVRVAIRIVPAGKKMYAIARIDPEDKIIELGTRGKSSAPKEGIERNRIN